MGSASTRGTARPVEGWAETSEVTALEIAQRFEDAARHSHYLHRYPRRPPEISTDVIARRRAHLDTPPHSGGRGPSIEDVKALLAPRANNWPARSRAAPMTASIRPWHWR
jgi:hypothetical protein